MNLEAIKEATLAFFKTYYAEHGKPPSVKLAWTKVEGLTKRNFYVIFKGGQAEACTLSGIPVPKDRIKTTAKARKQKDKPPETPALLEEEIKADEEETRLEEAKRREAAEERAIKARNELIEIEAKHNPKKIIPYLRILEPEITSPLFDLCKEAGLTPRRAWAEAVKVRGETWEKWGLVLKANGEEPHFKAYVSEVIEGYVPQKRLELAKERHRGDTYRCECNVCELRYEYEDKGDYTLFTCPDGCVQSHGGVGSVYPCPVCKELGRAVKLSYDRSRGVLYCKTCNFEGEVRGEKLNPVGTKAGAFRPQIVALEEKVKGLNVKLSEVQKQVNAGERRVQVLERKREREGISLAKLTAGRKREDKDLDAARDETAKERRLRDSLKRENNREKRKREVYNAMATFLTNPEMSDGDIDDIIRTLEAARELRKKPGHVGEAVKMTVEVRGKFLSKVAGKDFILKGQADRIREREIGELKAEYDRKLKAKDDTINVERRQRETAEREREALAPWRDGDMKKLERENSRLRNKVLKLEGENSDLESKLHLQRIMASS